MRNDGANTLSASEINYFIEVKRIGLSLLAVCCAVSSAVAAVRDSDLVSRTDDREMDCLQYIPLVLPEIMKVCGQPTRSDWGRLAVSQSFSVVLMAGSVYTLKHIVRSERPDRSDRYSFPSGHSAWAFAGATVVAKELGWRSSWYSVGAYAFATGVAVERIAARRHSALDVAAGALVGVVMTEAGYFIADKIYGDRGFGEKYRLSIRPAALAAPYAVSAGTPDAFAVSPGITVCLKF